MKFSKSRPALLVFLGLAALCFFLLPKLPGAYVRSALESEFSVIFSCESQRETFKGIYFNGVTLKDRETGELMLEAEQVAVKTGLFARLNFKGLRRKIHFEKPVLYFRKEKSGHWNWITSSKAQPAGISVKSKPASLSFSEGKLRYQDNSFEPAFETEVIFSSAEFFYKPGETLNGAVRFTGTRKIPGTYLFGFTYNPEKDSFVFQLNSVDTKVEVHGTVEDFSTSFYTKFSSKIHLKEMKLVSPKDIGFAGLLTLQAEGMSQGSHPQSFLKYLSLSGAFDIRHGTMLRNNILGQILRSLKPVASLALPAGQGLPPDYKGLIRGADTAYEVLQTRIQVTDGLLYLDEVRIKHPEYYVEGEGSYDIPNGKMDFRARFAALEDLSAWFISKNKAFKAFENESGRLVLPFLYRGLTPDIELEMDWDQISAIVKDKELKEAAQKQGQGAKA